MAAYFAASLSFITKLLNRQHTTGMMAAPRSRATARRGRRPVPQRVQPDAALAKIDEALLAAGGSMLSRTAIWRVPRSVSVGNAKKHSCGRARYRTGRRLAPIIRTITWQIMNWPSASLKTDCVRYRPTLATYWRTLFVPLLNE